MRKEDSFLKNFVHPESFIQLASVDFFSRASDEAILPKKLEKVGPFECDELEKHCRVSAKCYPTKVPALYTMIHYDKGKVQFSVSGSAACFPTDEKSIAGDK